MKLGYGEFRNGVAIPRVLIPSDNRDWVVNWAEAYARAGCDVVTGTFNFYLRTGLFDLVHYQWPEELCGWTPPTPQLSEEISAVVEWWRRRCPTIITINNLLPHGSQENVAYRQLYEKFIATASVVIHFSKASAQLVKENFPAACERLHIVVPRFNYERLLALQKSRGSTRGELGLDDDDFVILVFGAIRSWNEVGLVQQAMRAARVHRKRLLMAGRFREQGPRWRQRWRCARWKLWLSRIGASVIDRYIPDAELYKAMDSADVVIVPRLRDLSSGIPSLAMTFGRTVIAPNHGAFPEYLADTGNFLYESGNAQSLARAIEAAASADREAIGRKNQELATGWSWDSIIQNCLETVELGSLGNAVCYNIQR